MPASITAPSMDREQHFTTGAVLASLRELVSSLDLRTSHVLEIGAGRGAVTELILDGGAKHVTAFEIEPGLCALRDDRLTLIEEDVTTADLSFSWDCMIAVPPYGLLPFIAEVLSARSHLLMIPDKPAAYSLFPGATELVTFDGASFDPPSRGRHVVIQRGFR